MGERCAECAELRRERDEAIKVQEGLAKQWLEEVEGHKRTQEWLDEFMGQAAQGQADMLTTMAGALAVTGLIAAIYVWREWLLFFNPACRRCCITLATYRCHTCGYDRRLDA